MKNDYLYTDHMAVGYHGIPLIRNIDIRVRKGEILSLIGPNGSGKSTILKSIIRQLNLINGTVYLDGRNMSCMSEQHIAQRLSILMTDHIHPELMSCEDIVATGRYPYTGRLGLLTDADREKVQEAMKLVHAEELAHCDFSQISDGQRQRILLARAICQDPEIIVLDEPTSFLDIRYKLELLSILKTLVREKQVAVILSLHELDLAQKISDYIVCVHNNRIERYGTPEEVFLDDYIRTLYDLDSGSYNEYFGSLELDCIRGTPQVFVIGGGGKGISVYRRLQRKGIPFAAGILQENDIDYPIATALASEIIAERAYHPICEYTYQKALTLMEKCAYVVCCVSEFGPMNERNKDLLEQASSKRIEASALCI